MMRLAIVCGGRNYGAAQDDCQLERVAEAADERAHIFASLAKASPAIVVQGGAPGADLIARQYCEQRGVRCVEVPALWHAHGRSAGPRRNEDMLSIAVTLAENLYSDKMSVGVIAFPGGKGTENMVALAEKAGVPVWRP
jgi:hypothetical protein